MRFRNKFNFFLFELLLDLVLDLAKKKLWWFRSIFPYFLQFLLKWPIWSQLWHFTSVALQMNLNLLLRVLINDLSLIIDVVLQAFLIVRLNFKSQTYGLRTNKKMFSERRAIFLYKNSAFFVDLNPCVL